MVTLWLDILLQNDILGAHLPFQYTLLHKKYILKNRNSLCNFCTAEKKLAPKCISNITLMKCYFNVSASLIGLQTLNFDRTMHIMFVNPPIRNMNAKISHLVFNRCIEKNLSAGRTLTLWRRQNFSSVNRYNEFKVVISFYSFDLRLIIYLFSMHKTPY